jgi:predicted nucleotidyltransferase
MIREGKPLPADALENMPKITELMAADRDVMAFYSFGSLVQEDLKPLSDFDFGVLLSNELDRTQMFDKHLELIGVFTDTFRTDEIDLVLLNDAPMRFSYNIIKSGKLMHCRDSTELTEFIEKTVKLYLDFRFFRDAFDEAFLKGIGYIG